MSHPSRKARRGRPRRRDEDVGPTPETLAKLEPDVLLSLHDKALITADEERAGRALSAFWRALERGMLPKSSQSPRLSVAKQTRFKGPIDRLSDREAQFWEEIYMPWASRHQRIVVSPQPRMTSLDLVRRVVLENAAPTTLAAKLRLAEDAVTQALRAALNDVYRTPIRKNAYSS